MTHAPAWLNSVATVRAARANPWPGNGRQKRNAMKNKTQTEIDTATVLTAEGHLRLQEQIERRANELWRAAGCRDGTSLSDWLQAEREVLEQRARAYQLRVSTAAAAGQTQRISASRRAHTDPLATPERYSA